MPAIDMGALAEANLKRFAVTLCELVRLEGRRFHLVVGAGDSGLVMLKLLSLSYGLLGVSVPPLLRIPIVRYKTRWDPSEGNRFDNGPLIPEVQARLRTLSPLSSVLFVDDEIEQGTTAKATLELLVASIHGAQSPDGLTFTIVAEDHGFAGLKWVEDSREAGVKIEFRPFAIGIKGVYHVLTHLVPPQAGQLLMEASTGRVITPKQRLNVMLGLPVKDLVDGRPRFTNRLRDTVRMAVSGLDEMTAALTARIESLIADALAEDCRGVKP